MKSWLELGKQQRARRNGVYLDGIIVPGHEPVPVRAPNRPKGLPAKPTAHGAQAAVTHCGQRSRASVRYIPVCVYLFAVMPGDRARRCDALTCGNASLDTRAAYLDRCRLRTSEARSVDHAGVELRNPGHMLCAGCLTQSPAGLGAPPAHRPRFCAGQVGKARCVPAGSYEEMSQVDRAAGAAWRGRCEVGDDNQLVLADRASGQERSLLPVLAADKALRCGGAIGHGRYPRIPGRGRHVRIAAGSSRAGIAESFPGVLTAAGYALPGCRCPSLAARTGVSGRRR